MSGKSWPHGIERPVNVKDPDSGNTLVIDADGKIGVIATRSKVEIQTLFNAIPVNGSKSSSLDITNVDNIAIVVELVGTTSTAVCTPEGSIDNINWIPLSENSLSVTPTVDKGLFNINQASFQFIRMGFDSIVSGGDTFTVKATAKGLV